MVEVEWRRDEFVVFFKGVIDSIIKSKFNMDKFIFGDLIGLSERSVRDLRKNPDIDISSKRHTQLINRINAEIMRSSENGFMLEHIRNLIEKPSEENEVLWIGARKGFEAAVLNQLMSDEVLLDVDRLEAPPFYYIFNFVDLVHEPLFKYKAGRIDNLSEYFPYSALGDDEVKYGINKIRSSEGYCNKDSLLFNSILNSFVAVLAAIYLDVERYNKIELDKDLSSFRRLIKEAWGSGNSSAYFFRFSRDELNFSTHEEFYDALSRNFPDTDKETVKRNYKRWCKTGKIDRQQWQNLSGSEDPNSAQPMITELKHTFISLLDNIKSLAGEHGHEYEVEDFLADLDRWCLEIKNNVSLDSWQPFKTASDKFTCL
jgi:hypothetical protein